MRKELVVYADEKPVPLTIRNYSREDFDGLIDVQRASFPPPFPAELWWNEEQLSEHVSRYPEGALCAVAGGRIVGSMTGLLVSEEQLAGKHDWATLTDNGYIRNHDPAGSTLYVVDICVMPAYRKAGVGKWLMQSMYETVVQQGKQRLLGGGRMPGYHKHAATATPEQYLENVMAGLWHDPVIGFLLRCGRLPVGIAHDYLEDEESCGYAALMEWRNPFIQ